VYLRIEDESLRAAAALVWSVVVAVVVATAHLTGGSLEVLHVVGADHLVRAVGHRLAALELPVHAHAEMYS